MERPKTEIEYPADDKHRAAAELTRELDQIRTMKIAAESARNFKEVNDLIKEEQLLTVKLEELIKTL